MFGVIVGIVLSLGASHVGRLVWEKRSGSEDLLFSELMIWGYLHRRHTQRRLASALDLLGPMSEAQRRTIDGLSTKEQAKLLEQLVAGMETRDPYLHGHSRRVARHSWMIAKRMGLPRDEVARIRTAAAIHDVGKIETPKAILHKAGPLTDAEYEVIKRHPGDGAVMAGALRDSELTSMIRHHHERLDGTGYPDGLRAQEIPLGARIIAVADTFDAITSERPYRPASAHKRAIDILKDEAGTQLDPAVVRAFCAHYAGRAPVALWSSLAALPGRVLSWLGTSVATAVSVAKVVAVAAVVGGAAVTSSTLGLPAATQHPAQTRPVSSVGLQAQVGHSTLSRVLVPTGPAATTRGRHGRVPAPSLQGRSATPQLASASAGSATAQPSQPASSGGSSGSARGETKPEPPVKTGPPVEGKGEPPVKTGPPVEGKGEPPVKSEPPGKGKGEPPVRSEPPGKGKGEPPVKPEPPVKGEGKGEPPVKSEPPGKTEGKGEPPVKSEPPAKGRG
jgi:hypothetical protein